MIILEFHKFNLLEDLSKSLSTLLPNIKTTGKYLYASTLTDKSGNPITRIDSKKPVIGLMLKINDDSIEIKSIVNNTDNRGVATQIIQTILSHLDSGSTIIIDQDVSGGYWNKIIKRYPDYNWIFS
jgi:hypothetical protein